MKKIKYVLISLLAVLLLAGCGSTKPQEPEEPKQETETTQYLVFVNVEGLGEIAVAQEGEGDPVFEEEYPVQSYGSGVPEGAKMTITCRPSEEGWQFVKWKRNGENYSTDQTITVTVDEQAEFVAVFMTVTGYEGEPVKDIHDAKVMGDVLALPYSESGYSETDAIFVFELDGVSYAAVAEVPAETGKALFEIDFEDPERDKKANDLLAPLEITHIYNLTESRPEETEYASYVGKTGDVLLEDGWFIHGYYTDEMKFMMQKGIYNYDVIFEGSLPEDFNEEPEQMKALTVKSITFTGIGSVNAEDLDGHAALVR